MVLLTAVSSQPRPRETRCQAGLKTEGEISGRPGTVCKGRRVVLSAV